jgi:hypothetical protein
VNFLYLIICTKLWFLVLCWSTSWKPSKIRRSRSWLRSSGPGSPVSSNNLVSTRASNPAAIHDGKMLRSAFVSSSSIARISFNKCVLTGKTSSSNSTGLHVSCLDKLQPLVAGFIVLDFAPSKVVSVGNKNQTVQARAHTRMRILWSNV